MRSDRLSAYEQWDLSLDRALFAELEHGVRTIESGETREGAQRFAGGRGRGGRFDDL
jgi:enoyl-CoA hydratase